MSQIPSPFRAAIGLVAFGVDTLRALPERTTEAPEKLVEFPVLAVSSALQISLRLQQQYAALINRGDEVLSRFSGVPEEAPAWATFDDEATTPPAEPKAPPEPGGPAKMTEQAKMAEPAKAPPPPPPAKKAVPTPPPPKKAEAAPGAAPAPPGSAFDAISDEAAAAGPELPFVGVDDDEIRLVEESLAPPATGTAEDDRS